MTYNFINHIGWSPPLNNFLIFVGCYNEKTLKSCRRLKREVDKVANVNEFSRREDEEINRQIQNAEDNISSLLDHWLHKRD